MNVSSNEQNVDENMIKWWCNRVNNIKFVNCLWQKKRFVCLFPPIVNINFQTKACDVIGVLVTSLKLHFSRTSIVDVTSSSSFGKLRKICKKVKIKSFNRFRFEIGWLFVFFLMLNILDVSCCEWKHVLNNRKKCLFS